MNADSGDGPRVSEGARIVLSVLDQAKAELEHDFPGWRIWYVPRTSGPTRWCAQRLPLLHEDRPEWLAQAMADVEAGKDADDTMFPLPFGPETSEAGA